MKLSRRLLSALPALVQFPSNLSPQPFPHSPFNQNRTTENYFVDRLKLLSTVGEVSASISDEAGAAVRKQQAEGVSLATRRLEQMAFSKGYVVGDEVYFRVLEANAANKNYANVAKLVGQIASEGRRPLPPSALIAISDVLQHCRSFLSDTSAAGFPSGTTPKGSFAGLRSLYAVDHLVAPLWQATEALNLRPRHVEGTSPADAVRQLIEEYVWGQSECYAASSGSDAVHSLVAFLQRHYCPMLSRLLQVAVESFDEQRINEVLATISFLFLEAGEATLSTGVWVEQCSAVLAQPFPAETISLLEQTISTFVCQAISVAFYGLYAIDSRRRLHLADTCVKWDEASYGVFRRACVKLLNATCSTQGAAEVGDACMYLALFSSANSDMISLLETAIAAGSVQTNFTEPERDAVKTLCKLVDGERCPSFEEILTAVVAAWRKCPLLSVAAVVGEDADQEMVRLSVLSLGTEACMRCLIHQYRIEQDVSAAVRRASLLTSALHELYPKNRIPLWACGSLASLVCQLDPQLASTEDRSAATSIALSVSEFADHFLRSIMPQGEQCCGNVYSVVLESLYRTAAYDGDEGRHWAKIEGLLTLLKANNLATSETIDVETFARLFESARDRGNIAVTLLLRDLRQSLFF